MWFRETNYMMTHTIVSSLKLMIDESGVLYIEKAYFCFALVGSIECWVEGFILELPIV